MEARLTPIERIREAVTCKICDQFRQLHVLSCLHRVCADCIKRLPYKEAIISGVKVTRRNCPFCRKTTTLKPGTTNPKCILTAEVQDIVEQCCVETASKETQTIVNVAVNIGTQTTQSCPQTKGSCYQTIGIFTAERNCQMPHLFKFPPQKSRTTDSSDSFPYRTWSLCNSPADSFDYAQLSVLVAQLSAIVQYGPSRYLTTSHPSDCTDDTRRELMKLRKDNEDAVKHFCCVFKGSISWEQQRWWWMSLEQGGVEKTTPCGNAVFSESLNWFYLPGSNAANPSGLTAIQSMRLKTIQRVWPKQLYKSKWLKVRDVS